MTSNPGAKGATSVKGDHSLSLWRSTDNSGSLQPCTVYFGAVVRPVGARHGILVDAQFFVGLIFSMSPCSLHMK